MSEPIDELRAQMIELQTQMAFQEDTLRALDAAVTDQQQQLQRLEQLGARLERQFREMLERLDERPEQQRPPHY